MLPIDDTLLEATRTLSGVATAIVQYVLPCALSVCCVLHPSAAQVVQYIAHKCPIFRRTARSHVYVVFMVFTPYVRRVV